MHGKTIVQSTQVTAPIADILRSLGVPLPKRILEVSEEAPPLACHRYMPLEDSMYPIDSPLLISLCV